ncbi:MAG: HEAT repeat domain-containing protein [Acidobacteria bacterium]|nr:HEAT repeat domain-containing protein [Acidobacteriota bacterium]MCW5949809.1 HEAT repeat domain-containing protein [Pyrinomonadaceae bacterium]
MKRLHLALVLCLGLLAVEAFILLPRGQAKTLTRRSHSEPNDLLRELLRQPAPPPPNPSVVSYDKETQGAEDPPNENAPIADILKYWTGRAVDDEIAYGPKMSDKTFERLAAEIDRDPTKLPQLLDSFPKNERSAEFVKRIWDREGATGVFAREERRAIRKWLLYNSPYFTNDLARLAQTAGDAGSYVTGRTELLNLTLWDFEKARPMIDRLYNSSSTKPSRALALWALYKNALIRDSFGDSERYRDELKKIVEDRDLPGPMRDLALDALVHEKEWPGRDEWYLSLMRDPTLLEIPGYTGLTTLIQVSPPGKYDDKMISLIATADPVTRAAAIRNLTTRRSSLDKKALETLLPWLEDPNWAKDGGGTRLAIVTALSDVKLPESVPGLIRIIDEKQEPVVSDTQITRETSGAAGANAGSAANAAAAAVAAVAAAAAAAGAKQTSVYPFRTAAIAALAKQEDSRAVPVLRRLLNEIDGWEQLTVVTALRRSGGFSIAEQIDALEFSLLEAERHERENEANVASNVAGNVAPPPPPPILNPASANLSNISAGMVVGAQADNDQIRRILGDQIVSERDVGEDLARGVVELISAIEDREPNRAARLRKAVLNWSGPAVNLLLLRDMKLGRVDVDSAIKLLSERKTLRQNHSEDIFDLRHGPPVSVAFAACLLEDTSDQRSILENGDPDTKAFLLAFGRMVRSPLPVAMVGPLTGSPNKTLAAAAEAFLESEDSPEARAVVLGLHPGEAKILGAWSAFWPKGADETLSPQIWALFRSFEDEKGYVGWLSAPDDTIVKTEESLRKEILGDRSLLGVYAYDGHYVRIYSDRVIFSWDEDDARYRERPLEPAEFEQIKVYIRSNQMDDLPPFDQCGGEYCVAKELLMLGRNGGRRLYMSGEPPPVFSGLEKIFDDLRRPPAAVKYVLSREVPGLELVLTYEDLHAETVWRSGNELRAAIRDVVVLKKVRREISDALDTDEIEEPASATDGDGSGESAAEKLRRELTAKRALESLSWRTIVNGKAVGAAEQPPGFEFIPERDATSVQPDSRQWMARYGGVEYRKGPDGLYRVAGGRAHLFKKGKFGTPLVTTNGRWLITFGAAGANPDSEEAGLLRINLVTGRVLKTKVVNEYQALSPGAYLASINKVVLFADWTFYQGESPEQEDDEIADMTPADPDPTFIYLLDPDTGAITQPKGEFRPLAQQSYRQLQKASVPGTFWAALQDVEANETLVGTYDVRTFKFTLVRRVPKILFNSMMMWVDEPEGRMYFVYRGHILRLPLRP